MFSGDEAARERGEILFEQDGEPNLEEEAQMYSVNLTEWASYAPALEADLDGARNASSVFRRHLQRGDRLALFPRSVLNRGATCS